MHFSYLMERYGAPIVVLNLMKQHEKKRFEQQLTDGFYQGIKYLRQVRLFLRVEGSLAFALLLNVSRRWVNRLILQVSQTRELKLCKNGPGLA